MPWKHRFVLLGVVAAIAVAPLHAGTHVNEKVGYKIKYPNDFEPLSSVDQNAGDGVIVLRNNYVLDRFRGTKDVYVKDTPFPYRRFMTTFYFPERSAADIAKARAEAEEKAKQAASENGKSTYTVSAGDKIYLSFEEYAKDNITGFFFDGEKSAKVAGFPVRIFEMKFEKLTNVPQRWVACAYEIQGGEFAVMFSCTEQHFDEFMNEHKSTFNSFKMLNDSGLTGPKMQSEVTVDDDDEDEMTAEQIAAKRKRQKDEAYARCLETLPKGWRSLETDHFLVAYEDDPKYAKQVGNQAEAVLDWLGENFGSIGDGYVQSMIIRLYAKDELIPRVGGLRLTLGRGHVREVSFGKPTSKGWTSEFDSLNLAIMHTWFDQKNDELWSRMPAWLEWGLNEYIEDAYAKGSRLTFAPDEWEKDAMVEARNAQKKFTGNPDDASAPLKSLKTLMSLDSEALSSGENGRYAQAQCASVVRYLIEGPGAKQKKTSSLLQHYFGHLYDIVDEVEKEIDAREKESDRRKARTGSMSDEERLAAEDDEYRKRRDQAYDAVARDILTKSRERTFKDWDDKDWQAFDSSWMKYAEGRTK